jgi:hypothetical protein
MDLGVCRGCCDEESNHELILNKASREIEPESLLLFLAAFRTGGLPLRGGEEIFRTQS